MADIQTDIQSIQFMVNNSRSKEEAVELFYSMEGVDLPKDVAESILVDSMSKKFNVEKKAVLSQIRRLENRLGGQ